MISVDHIARRMRLSLAPKTGNPAAEAAAGDPAGGLQPGNLVEGIVASIITKEVCFPAFRCSRLLCCASRPSTACTWLHESISSSSTLQAKSLRVLTIFDTWVHERHIARTIQSLTWI